MSKKKVNHTALELVEQEAASLGGSAQQAAEFRRVLSELGIRLGADAAQDWFEAACAFLVVYREQLGSANWNLAALAARLRASSRQGG